MTDEFMLHLTFTDFKNLVTKAGVENEDHWFSYKLLDDVYHSDTFLGSQSGPTPYTEMIKLNIPKVVGNGEVWSKELLDRFVLHVFLVANKVIVSTTQINLFSSVVSNALPIKSKTTATLLSIDELADAGHLTVIAEIRNSSNELEYIQKPLNSPIPPSPAKHVPPQADEYDDDEFEDQEGEKSPHREVHFPGNLPEDDEGQRQLDYLRSEDNTDSEKRRREKEMAENCLRKFQITIAVKGVGGLSRAANTLTTHIIDYPFLNPNLPLTYHTHHVKVDGRSEVQIPGDKCASYDCCMSRRELREILVKHPVPILVKNKTIGIGSEDLGVVLVDLRSVLETTPKFQSPLAKNSQQKLPRNFSTIEDYLYYREKMCDRDIYLPEDPVYVHSVETRHIPFSKPDPVTRAYEPNGYLHVVVVIKDLCRVEGKIGVPVKQGYRMHNGGVYENDGEDDHFEAQEQQQQEQHRPKEMDVNSALSEVEHILAKGRQEIQRERDEWATFQREEEFKWKELLKQKEVLLRQHIQEECNRELARKADDLRRAQEECGKIEIKLKAELARVEQLSHQAVLDAAHHKQMYEQKVITVDLIARKARQEANESKLKDQARADASEQRVKELEEKLKTARDDLYKADKRYDDYRAQQRGTPETKLREENAELRAVLSERTAEIERQKKLVAQEKLQTEHYRAQVHSLALALKKERAKSADVARMELEQLRLEFLAREERYILDGDREELRNIRNELSALKSFTLQSTIEERNKGVDSSQQHHSHSQHPNQSSHQQNTSRNLSRSPTTPPGTSSPYMPREYQIREYQPASREHLMQQRDLTDLRASTASQPSDETKTMTPERSTVRSVERGERVVETITEKVYTQTTTNRGSGDSNNSNNKAPFNITMPSNEVFIAINSARQKELDNLVKALQRMQAAGVYREDDAAVVQVKAKITELTGGGDSAVEY